MTEMTRPQFAMAAVLVVLVVLLGSHALGSTSQGDPATAAAAPTVASGERSPARITSTAPTAPRLQTAELEDSSALLYVHVAGRVRRPGLYKLHAGARIADAIRKAGGRAKGADLDAVNLAAKVRDGDQVLVPRRAAAAPSGTAPAIGAGTASVPGAAPGGPTAVISLNSATEEQLETIDGVGPATAAKILAFRQQNGGFRSVDDLAQISGIGPKRLEAMRPHVRV